MPLHSSLGNNSETLSQKKKKKYIYIYIYIYIYKVVKFLDAETKMVVTRSWREEKMGSCSVDTKFQRRKKKVLEETCHTTV